VFLLQLSAGSLSALRGYRYKQAHAKAVETRRQASARSIRMVPKVIQFIEEKIREKWSPDQISGLLKANGTPISHEWIYLYIWKDKRKGGTLYQHLRHRGKNIIVEPQSELAEAVSPIVLI